MFTKEIEEALADGHIDLAVHSLKDLPTELSEQFEIAAVPQREDPRDAFCSKKYSSIEELPQGALVGTSSLRREAQLKAIRPDVVVHPLRGNVDTRLRKLESGDYDAIILATAGLNRLGRTEVVRQILPIEIMCPAAGQGALAIETRAQDESSAGISRPCGHTRRNRLRTRVAQETRRRLPGSHRSKCEAAGGRVASASRRCQPRWKLARARVA